MALPWIQPTHLPISRLFSFRSSYHCSAGLDGLKHRFIMSPTISDLCLPSGRGPHAFHYTISHLLPLQQACMSCGSSSPAFLPGFLAHRLPPPDQRSCFHMCICSSSLCRAHRGGSGATLRWCLSFYLSS